MPHEAQKHEIRTLVAVVHATKINTFIVLNVDKFSTIEQNAFQANGTEKKYVCNTMYY